ncbi:MAG: VOC family protein [Gemmatimonadota bacterium]
MNPSSFEPIDAGVTVGHVHLKVSDLERSIAFYQDALGFEMMQRMGDSAAFMSAGGYHHHLGLNTWQSKGAGPAPRGAAGLFHAAFLYPSRVALARAYRRLVRLGVPLEGSADHGVSEALYLRDPDDNGLELYRDRPRAEWPTGADGSLQMFSHPLDLDALLSLAAEAGGE